MSETIHILARSPPISLRRRVALGLVLLAATVMWSPGVASADGDPASDVLVSENAFVPWDASTPPGDQARVAAVLAAVAKAGYPVRVALIASSSDLGSVTALWRQPQNYAHFLWDELSFAVHASVLVVMPGGFGLYTGLSPTASEQAALARTRAAATGAGLATAAVTAVQNLAAAAGHPVPTATPAPGNSSRARSGGTDTVSWVVLAAGAVLIAVAWAASLRAQPLRGRDRGVAS